MKENNTKKNNTNKLLLLLLLISITAIVLLATTYAKYITTSTGSDSGRVAKWSFTVDSTDITAKQTFTFYLFKTIKDTDGTTVETDVVSSNSDKVIAPGTSGSFDMVLTNNSEVTAQYGITYTVTNTATIPVKFSVDGKTWTDSLENVVESDATKLAANGGSKTITVKWKWAYEGTDAKDIELGKAGTAKLEVKAAVTATQVD